MSVKGSKVAIIGGSIAGTSAAIALTKAGCDVTVFERETTLSGRGFGVGGPVSLLQDLIRRGYLPDDYIAPEVSKRWWLVADGTPNGRLLWEQPAQAVTNNWGVLWSALRKSAHQARFFDGTAVEGFHLTDSGVRLSVSGRADETFDVLVGADGYRSAVRRKLHPSAEPAYAGYVVWRGSFPEAGVDHEYLDRMSAAQAWPVVMFARGHGPLHVIPGTDGSVRRGERRVNWAVYLVPDGTRDYTQPTSVPPGSVTTEDYAQLEQILEHHYPPHLADLIRHSGREGTSIQPIYDLTLPSYASPPILLIGDAGAITRPHTASGATKAIMDALVLEDIATSHSAWDAVFDAYDAERTPASNRIVELSRRLGQAQVLSPPDWADMQSDAMPNWFADVMSNESLYLFPGATRPA